MKTKFGIVGCGFLGNIVANAVSYTHLGLLGANGQRRKHAAQRQSEDHTQNFFHSA